MPTATRNRVAWCRGAGVRGRATTTSGEVDTILSVRILSASDRARPLVEIVGVNPPKVNMTASVANSRPHHPTFRYIPRLSCLRDGPGSGPGAVVFPDGHSRSSSHKANPAASDPAGWPSIGYVLRLWMGDRLPAGPIQSRAHNSLPNFNIKCVWRIGATGGFATSEACGTAPDDECCVVLAADNSVTVAIQ